MVFRKGFPNPPVFLVFADAKKKRAGMYNVNTGSLS